jgi:hypothetical protein
VLRREHRLEHRPSVRNEGSLLIQRKTLEAAVNHTDTREPLSHFLNAAEGSPIGSSTKPKGAQPTVVLKEYADVSSGGRDNRKDLTSLRRFQRKSELTAESIEVLLPKSLKGRRRRIRSHIKWQLTEKLRGAQKCRSSAAGA